MRFSWRFLVWVLTVIVLGCGTRDERLNLVIIGIDTLRSDHLGCYGYEYETSPVIDEFAAGGVLFENAISGSPWTLPSFSTVFTSLYPSQHGADSPKNRLCPSVPTLAAILDEGGYATGALINASVLKEQFGVNRGFDFYDVVGLGKRRADETTDNALEWIDRNKDDPFFMFIHYFDVHDPYSPPAPYDTLFDPGYEGIIENVFRRKRIGAFRGGGFSRLKYLSEADWRHIEALYDGEIAFTDQAIGVLLEGLERLGLTENTLIVLLSDHGEEFYDHGSFGHGHTLYGELLRVPLVFSLPGTLPEGARHDGQVRLVDVMPTVLDVMGFELDPRFEGVSLKPLLLGEGEPVGSKDDLVPAAVAYSEALCYGPQKKAITGPSWKAIYDTDTGLTEMYNVVDDPGELKNLAGANPEMLGRMDGLLTDTVLSVSDTWYVRISGDGEAHDFDIRVAAAGARDGGRILMHRFLDDRGGFVDGPAGTVAEISTSALTLRGLRIDVPMTLAIVVEPDETLLEFDIHIDGEVAAGRIFVGDSLSEPTEMPFTADPGPAGNGRMRRLAADIEGPHLVVWHAERRYGGRTGIELDADTRKELRALGYIQ